MSCKAEMKIENFLEYYGSIDDVKKKIDECDTCGAKLLQSHLPDYNNMVIQETSRCLDCGGVHKKVVHIIN
ncbi:MAG: hypothetical protein H6621_03980 [Halobacteriovoraceae bacterium]|nr:hypothetical protein [Halobacteriovoraceae bacterium]MCB9094208.1 hypothetical protein [Halobacteriovoraceae bacterium]